MAAMFGEVGQAHMQGWEFGISFSGSDRDLCTAGAPVPTLPAALASGMEPTIMPSRMALAKGLSQAVLMKS